MKLSERLPFILVITVVVAAIAVIGWRIISPSSSGTMVEVRVPALSATAQRGKSDYDKNCASCHGVDGAGTEKGPPFIHEIYNPGHHGDASFMAAVERGVPSHHWNFGDMPPLPEMTRDQMLNIIRYLRELQLANGIRYKPHRM